MGREFCMNVHSALSQRKTPKKSVSTTPRTDLVSLPGPLSPLSHAVLSKSYAAGYCCVSSVKYTHTRTHAHSHAPRTTVLKTCHIWFSVKRHGSHTLTCYGDKAERSEGSLGLRAQRNMRL